MTNPHEYDDDAYVDGTIQLHRALSALWEAGASIENIENEIASALDDAVGNDSGTPTGVDIRL